VSDNADAISSSLRTPFFPADAHLQSHFVKIAETDYVNPENEGDLVHLIICSPNVSFDNAKLLAKYGHLNADKVNFVNDVKSYVTAFSLEALRKRVESNGGKLKFRLNDTEVELTVKEDFYFSAHEQANSK
jgi:hypothetical protein